MGGMPICMPGGIIGAGNGMRICGLNIGNGGVFDDI